MRKNNYIGKISKQANNLYGAKINKLWYITVLQSIWDNIVGSWLGFNGAFNTIQAISCL